ncbi:velvet factor-domain-containing protein [Aspergillus ambiguus]|uniref:velvet factor-domain-containing protein n=1 Tax=Aspergillus ambiguus TaxID=176160 RepID=UPI003CCCB396
MATRPPLTPPINETEHSVSRITREGKKITYKLSVMQQPERARACGAGAKSSADRRPVDPPPVVELRIFESDPNDDVHKTDITFAYNANFFLFATLDTARPMAQGRLAPAPTCPVLTGVPVAGVAYLDRPTQAGYFIFPDLSVRHEGVYRLNFHLYEETKDTKDLSEGAPLPTVVNTGKPSAPKSFLDFRLEVVSVPFTVFSAKKFPGLTTSTSLSRIIAEQGCRVRIRRDVRMRRRGEKRSDDYEFDEERAYRSSPRYSTPDQYAAANPVERPRSTSISAADPAYPYGPDAQRRPSATDYGYQAAQPYPRPMPPAPVSASSTPVPPAPPSHGSYQSHLAFGSTQTQYPAPHLPRTPQPAPAPHPSYAHARHPSVSEYESGPPSGPYPPSRLPTERPGYPKAPLPPLRLEPPKALNMPPTGEQPRSSDPNAYQSMAQPRSQTPSNPMPSLPPLKVLSGEYPGSQPIGMSHTPAPELASGKKLLWETAGPTLSKRSYEESFGHDERPLHNGMRPDHDSSPNPARRPSEDSGPSYTTPSYISEFRDQMVYKRANGRMANKISPALNNMMSAQGTVDLLVDANDPHRQLHQALHYACQHPRKHSRTSSYDTIESGWSSDESGRFDDADESDSSPQLTGATSPSNSNSHSAKRRRSNDWPNQPTPQAQAQAQPQAQHHHSLWPFHHHGRTQPGSPRASPATGKRPSGNSAAAASKKNLGRRSRFVEESMNDSVSEKPPSIFLREEPRSSSSASSSSRNGANAPGQRNSGIFRFGKAIASAFNPFGNAPQESKPATAANDALAQAEKAYAELKQAGYKGTAKGSYLQQQQQQQQQQAMGPDPVAARQHSRQNSGEGQSSIRNSFQDLRRAKSSLGISSISLLSNSNRRSEESDGAEVRRQKSRRELQKQAKLLKRVSNLEDKLERARRELQQLMGEDESEAQSQSQSQPLPQTQSQPESTETPTGLDEKTYHRKLLQEESTPLSSLSENVQRTPAKDKGNEPRRPTGKRPAAPKSSKQLTEDQTSGLAVDSPSRKRKSPEPAFAEGVDATETGTAKEHAQSTHEDEAPLPKTARGDSPRSVEHKQSRERLQSPEDRRERTQTPPPSSRRATGKRTPSSRRISNSRNTTPCLRMKKSRSDLRSASMDADGLTDADKENQEAELSPRKLYLQEQAQSSPSRSPGKRKHSYSYIPPVPPLPKDLAAAAAAAAAATKLDRQRVKESGQQRETQEYKWPEDIF